MTSHCRCCSGKFAEGDVLGDCTGCPECATKDRQISILTASLDDLRERIAAVDGELAGVRDAKEKQIVDRYE